MLALRHKGGVGEGGDVAHGDGDWGEIFEERDGRGRLEDRFAATGQSRAPDWAGEKMVGRRAQQWDW